MHLGLKLKTYHQSAKHRCKTLAQDAKKKGGGGGYGCTLPGKNHSTLY